MTISIVYVALVTYTLILSLAQAQERQIYWTDAKGKIFRGDDNGAAYEEIISTRIPSAIEIAEDHLYWVDQAGFAIKRSSLDGTVTEEILSEIGAVTALLHDPKNKKLYWLEQIAGKIWRANLDGTEAAALIEGLGYPSGLAIDTLAGKLYWGDGTRQQLQRANLDGTGVEDILPLQGIFRGLAIDAQNGKIYWIANSTREVKRANLDGQNLETILSDVTPFDLAVDSKAGKIYLADVGKIVRVNLDGTEWEELITGFVLGAERLALHLSGGKMYWIDQWTHKIQRANLNGTLVEDVLIGISPPRGVTLHVGDRKLYWTGFGELMRANFNGSGVEYLADVSCGVGELSDIALDPKEGKMYWISDTDCGGLELHRANLDGTNVQRNLLGTISQPFSIALDLNERKVYWTNAGRGKQFRAIRRANLDGSDTETLIDSLNSPGGIAVDPQNRKMYWIDFPGNFGSINRANFDGTNVDVVITELNFPFDIALDVQNNKMYWTERNPGKIRRANLDGTNIEDLFTGLNEPRRIVLTFDSSLWTGVDNRGRSRNDPEKIPAKFVLKQNYPNPFNTATTIEFHLLYPSHVRLEIFNLQGEKIVTLANRNFATGTYKIDWDAKNLTSGIYVGHLRVNGFGEIKKLILLK
ncbi:DUF5050 domain-containing protein [candidate division KSB1 bacterium]|nr:DUF5050 domain-containing protein [candidate division KSB1 bacterium]